MPSREMASLLRRACRLSWRNDRANALYFYTKDWGIFSTLNCFIHCCIFSRQTGARLIVNDSISCLSNELPFVRSILRVPRVDWIEFNNNAWDESRSYYAQRQTIHAFLRNMDRALFREEFSTLAHWNRRLLRASDDFMRRADLYSRQYDLGVHIRRGDKILFGEMPNIELDRYVECIRRCLRPDCKTRVFVMTDDFGAYEHIRERLPDECELDTLTTPSQRGHRQLVFNQMSPPDKYRQLVQLCSEVRIMQRIPCLIMTLSSNVASFIHASHPNARTKVLSLDRDLDIVRP
jgi:hypothetical protein